MGPELHPMCRALLRGLHPSRAWSMSHMARAENATTAAPESRTWPSLTADSGVRYQGCVTSHRVPTEFTQLNTAVLGDEIAEKDRKG